MDLECSGGGTGQYGCGNMGISAGCGDIYGSGLSCQWIDVTDVEDGTYYLIVRANYDFIPDALGRAENSYENNHAWLCASTSTVPLESWKHKSGWGIASPSAIGIALNLVPQ